MRLDPRSASGMSGKHTTTSMKIPTRKLLATMAMATDRAKLGRGCSDDGGNVGTSHLCSGIYITGDVSSGTMTAR